MTFTPSVGLDDTSPASSAQAKKLGGRLERGAHHKGLIVVEVRHRRFLYHAVLTGILRAKSQFCPCRMCKAAIGGWARIPAHLRESPEKAFPAPIEGLALPKLTRGRPPRACNLDQRHGFAPILAALDCRGRGGHGGRGGGLSCRHRKIGDLYWRDGFACELGPKHSDADRGPALLGMRAGQFAKM